MAAIEIKRDKIQKTSSSTKEEPILPLSVILKTVLNTPGLLATQRATLHSEFTRLGNLADTTSYSPDAILTELEIDLDISAPPDSNIEGRINLISEEIADLQRKHLTYTEIFDGMEARLGLDGTLQTSLMTRADKVVEKIQDLLNSKEELVDCEGYKEEAFEAVEAMLRDVLGISYNQLSLEERLKFRAGLCQRQLPSLFRKIDQS